jgi:cell division protein FtsB
MYKIALLVLGLLLVLLQYRLWLGDGSYAGVYRLKHEIEDQARTNQALNSRNRQLEAEIRSLKQGDAATEERARADMGMIKSDESFFMIVPPEKSAAATATPVAPVAGKPGQDRAR